LEALDKFEIFKAEIENQNDLKIKIVRSDRGGVLRSAHPLWPSSWTFREVPYGNRIVAQFSRVSAERSSKKKKPYPDGYGQKYELWTGREPSLNHIRVWGCQAEAKVFNPNTGKLDPKIVNCHFIGYPEKSKGYHFYCPDRHTKFIETRHTALEDQMIRGSMVARKIDLEEKRVFVPTPMTQEPYFSLPVIVAPIA